MTAALPVSVTPRPGESIESWLEHLADANGLTTAQLLAATGRGRASTRYLTLAPSPETITRLAALARVDEEDVYAATLALTWQCVHVAHGHLDLSPVWRGKKPTPKNRARHRQFADSLAERQQLELAYALHKRA